MAVRAFCQSARLLPIVLGGFMPLGAGPVVAQSLPDALVLQIDADSNGTTDTMRLAKRSVRGLYFEFCQGHTFKRLQTKIPIHFIQINHRRPKNSQENHVISQVFPDLESER